MNKQKFYWTKADLSRRQRAVLQTEQSEFLRRIFSYTDTSVPTETFLLEGRQTLLEWESSRGDKISDFIATYPSVLCCKSKIWKLFSDKLTLEQISYPIWIGHEEYVIFRPAVFLDRFDPIESRYDSLSSGALSNFKSISLSAHPPSNLEFFGLLISGKASYHIFVSEAFVNLYHELALTGLVFLEAKANVVRIN